MINLNAILTYSIYLTGYQTNIMPVLSIVYGVVVIYFVVNTIKDISNREVEDE